MNEMRHRHKVLIMTPGLLPVPAVRGGAVEKLITDIIDENERRQVLEITVVTVSDENIKEDNYKYAHIIQAKQTALCSLVDRVIDKVQRMVHAKKSFRLLDRTLLNTLRNEANISEFDLIVVENMAGLALETVRTVKRKGSKAQIYFHVHNNIDMYRSPAVIKELADRDVTFISVSEYIKNEIHRIAPEAENRVLLNGLDIKVMDIKLREKKKQLRDKYRIPKSATVILYSGRIIAEKGVYELVQAFGRHKKMNPASNLFLVLAGDGSGADGKITEYAERVLEKLNLIPEESRNLGKIPYDSMAEIYALADVLAVPSLDSEPFGMVVLEGMSMGLPIITTASGGISEILEDDVGSIKVSGKNIVFEIVKVLDEINNEEAKVELSEMGRHNYDIFRGKNGVRKEEYFDRFLRTVGKGSI